MQITDAPLPIGGKKTNTAGFFTSGMIVFLADFQFFVCM